MDNIQKLFDIKKAPIYFNPEDKTDGGFEYHLFTDGRYGDFNVLKDLLDKHEIVFIAGRPIRQTERWRVPNQVPICDRMLAEKVGGITELTDVDGGFFAWKSGEIANSFFALVKDFKEQISVLYDVEVPIELIWSICVKKMDLSPSEYILSEKFPCDNLHISISPPTFSANESEYPFISCICITYNRPHLLPEVIQGFLLQDYPKNRRELIILDDAGQYQNQIGDGWELISVPFRFATCGEKRNAAHALSSEKTEFYVILDDDDIPLPNHISELVKVYKKGNDFVLPTYVYSDNFKNKEVSLIKKKTNLHVHSGGFSRKAFSLVNGYPIMDSGQDQAIFNRFRKISLKGEKSLVSTYIYRWSSIKANHLSCVKDGWNLKQKNEIIKNDFKVYPLWSRNWVELAMNAEKEFDKTEKLPNHLGGHFGYTNMDEGAIKYLNNIGMKTLLDIGCGPGGISKFAKSIGIDSISIDGDWNMKPDILHDYTTGPLKLDKIYDIGWSCEFLEHVEEKFLDNIFETFKCCKKIACTHAIPGQQGHHHVNCKDDKYWIDKFKKYGFILNIKQTEELRKSSSMKANFVRNTGMIFDKK